MKIKKLAAVLSAAALTVTSLSVAAFASSDGGSGSGTSKPAAVASVAVVNGDDLGDYAKKTEYKANAAKISATVTGTTVAVEVTGEISALTNLKDTEDANSKTSHMALKITLAEAATDTAGTSNVKWQGTALTTAELTADDARLNITDAANQKKTILFWVDLSQSSPITRTVAIGDDKESTITVNVTEAAAPEDPDPTEGKNKSEIIKSADGLTLNWGSDKVPCNVQTDKFPKVTVAAGDVIVVNFKEAVTNAQLKIVTKVGSDWTWSELELSPDAVENKTIATVASGTKFTHVIAAKDVDKFTEIKAFILPGQNGVVSSVEIYTAAKPAEGSGGDDPENPGGEAPSNPGYVVITPNDTTAADTTAAAPEVVTGANGESVEAPKDVVPEGAVLEAKEQTKEEAVKAVEAVKTTDDNKAVVETVKKSVEDGKAAVMDINLVKDGAKVQPNGTIKVTINIPEILKNAAQLFVYRVEDNGTFTDVKATVSGGKLVFSTGHFSTYIITSEALTGDAVVTEAAATTEPAATTAGGSTTTDDKNQATGVVLAVIPAMLAAAGVVAAKKRK